MLTVIMPMAGLGSRFAAVGETAPKPLIDVAGVPMFRLALDSVRSEEPNAKLVTIVLAEHQRRVGIADRLAHAEPSAQIAVVPELTGGSLETCLAAEPYLQPDEQVIVLDCDLVFRSPSYFESLRSIGRGQDSAAGVLVSFRSSEPRYSYAEVVDGRVTRTAEKQPISQNALIGAYGFASAEVFFTAARGIVERNLRTGNGEFYVSSVYNQLIAQGRIVRLSAAEQYWSMGTPEELKACLSDQAFLTRAQRMRAGIRETLAGAGS
jgi:NDP-sugar pyrophosphorylase family protein